MDHKQETIVAIESFQKKMHPSDNLTTERSKVLFHLGYSLVKMKKGEKKAVFLHVCPYPLTTQRVQTVTLKRVIPLRGWFPWQRLPW